MVDMREWRETGEMESKRRIRQDNALDRSRTKPSKNDMKHWKTHWYTTRADSSGRANGDEGLGGRNVGAKVADRPAKPARIQV